MKLKGDFKRALQINSPPLWTDFWKTQLHNFTEDQNFRGQNRGLPDVGQPEAISNMGSLPALHFSSCWQQTFGISPVDFDAKIKGSIDAINNTSSLEPLQHHTHWHQQMVCPYQLSFLLSHSILCETIRSAPAVIVWQYFRWGKFRVSQEIWSPSLVGENLDDNHVSACGS